MNQRHSKLPKTASKRKDRRVLKSNTQGEKVRHFYTLTQKTSWYREYRLTSYKAAKGIEEPYYPETVRIEKHRGFSNSFDYVRTNRYLGNSRYGKPHTRRMEKKPLLFDFVVRWGDTWAETRDYVTGLRPVLEGNVTHGYYGDHTYKKYIDGEHISIKTMTLFQFVPSPKTGEKVGLVVDTYGGYCPKPGKSRNKFIARHKWYYGTVAELYDIQKQKNGPFRAAFSIEEFKGLYDDSKVNISNS